MSQIVAFSKYQGLGNDFLIIGGLDGLNVDPPSVAALCDRRFGIGADGLIIVRTSGVADFKMDFFNADGSVAEMCGNGIRCFAKYLYDHGLTSQTTIAVETGAGVNTVDLVLHGEEVIGAAVDMGAPRLEAASIPVRADLGERNEVLLHISGRPTPGVCVSMGNPHCVVFVDDLEKAPVLTEGPVIETNPLFPNKTNVEFARVVSPTEIDLRVWERGVGETLACGTGACATAVAANLNGLTSRAVSINLPGGRLSIDWRDDDRVIMTGPAVEVFTGEIDLSTAFLFTP
ncbi:MAG: diaminopimelate epimerase [Candidatus Aquicultorales bacterium]